LPLGNASSGRDWASRNGLSHLRGTRVPAPKALEPDLELGILRRVRSLIIVIVVIAALVVVAGLGVSAMAAAAAPVRD
jgi:hypothetical protein